jgi:hypothetical protein
MTDPQHARDYDDRAVRAAYAVLIELGQVLGAYLDAIVIVGGAVPWLLLSDARPRHIGTTDIDLALDHEALADERYVSLVVTLEAAGYRRDPKRLKAFQLERTVNIDAGEPVPVIVDLLMPREAQPPKHKPAILKDFAVLKASGAKMALEYNEKRKFTGKMPDGRNNSVELLVASIPALLVMKGYALVGRDKKKDAYDIYYSIRNFEGGPAKLAELCRPLLQDEIAAKGYKNIAERFGNRDYFGPQTVRQFLEEHEALGDMTSDQMQTDAYGQVNAWARALGLLDS